MRRACTLALIYSTLALGSVASGEPSDPQFQRVEFLIQNGAPDLALRFLSNLQPDPSDSQKWMDWERLRFTIYREKRDWDAVEKRLEVLPSELPAHFMHTLLTQGIEVLIDSGRGDSVRPFLRELLWLGSYDSIQVMHWRRLAIRSYLSEGLLEDAQSAMASYQREFLPNDAGWSLLYARVLLQAGHPAKAADYLATVQSEEGRFLRLLSRLRSKTDSPSQVIKQARATLTKLPSDSPLRASLRALMAEAALYSDDLTVRVDALEHFYQLPMPTHLRGLFEYDVDQLWQAYIRLGEKTGNAANLLIGDDEPWLRLAESVSSAEPVKERSIYALLAERTSNLVDQEAHHLRFYLSLKQSRLEDTAIRLYTDKGRFSDIQQIPKAVRLQLVNLALARRNITLAASMAVDLSDVGEEIDHLGWSLKRARLAIYTGKFEDGVQILRDLINDNATFNRESVDRILQVVFDLQAVDYQRAAYALLSELYQRTSERGQQREILFWMGDALRGDDRFDSAAEHYLRSALFDYDGRDMWGQTARYRAAETLTDAGFVEDARRIYHSLLEDTADPKRKAILERSMQQLFLKNQGKSSTSH
jgi:hypothetical protein